MALPLSDRDPLAPISPTGADRDDAQSVGDALRATLLFLAILGFLAWAGAADAQPPRVPHQLATADAPSG